MADLIPRTKMALSILRSNPFAWFRHTQIEPRDLDLIAAEPVPFFEYNAGSYLRKIFHVKAGEDGEDGEDIEETVWQVETDDKCKELVRSAGAKMYGYDTGPSASIHWACIIVIVNITGAPSSGFNSGFLSTRPGNIRIFERPANSCPFLACEAMILRDCTSIGTTLSMIESIGSRKWDILCMKMGEDYDYPWMVVAVKDAGRRPSPYYTSCSCQDPSACGCVF